MNREDRILLADLGKLNRDVEPLAMRIMDESATTEAQITFALRLAEMAWRLQNRAGRTEQVIEGEVAVNPAANGGHDMGRRQDQ